MTLLRPFGARDTASRADPFTTARIKLTLLYLALITVIVVVLSFSLYSLHAGEVARSERVRREMVREREGLAELSPNVEDYLEELGRTVLIAGGLTIVVGGALSYLLAALTLRPIKRSVENEQLFFANAAHDLRTPLSVMRTEAEVALRSRTFGVSEARRALTSSLEEIGRMSTMVEQMLDLARRRSGAPGQRRFGPVDIGALVGAAASRMGRLASDKGVDLRVEAVAPARIHGDEGAVQRAVVNVLENAITYTPSGGTITVVVKHQGGHVVVSVQDTGIGIAPQDLPRITDPFHRGDQARRAHAGGAGLGLTIVKATMDYHRGTLQASSRPGQGTTISLHFPAA
ncbi:MAG TPA: HAMP domain-containing sensor histidine kinase [Spirochaetia bacterium]|nr:HAMP domain-containing sensor histidine kinase [Spirochaetia bacterium]